MANLSNINNKFLFTDGDFFKIGNLAPINNISGTESGISITNGNCASITLDNSAASGKTFVIYSAVNGSLNFFDADAASGRLIIDSSGNSTFAGNVTTNGDIIIDNAAGDPFLKLKTSAQEYVIRVDQSDSEKFQIRDVTNSLTRITLDTSGNVGIGTDSPATLLDVRGGGANTLPATTGTTPSTGTRFRLANTGGASAALDFGISTGGKSWLQSTDRVDLSVEYPFLINPNGGNVGIGTTTMNTTLNLYSASNTQIGFQDASTGVGTADGFRIGYNGTYGQLWLFENADFRIATNNTQRFSIDNDGITTVGNRGSDLVYDPTAYQNDLIVERKNNDGSNQLATLRFNVTGYVGQTTGEASIGAVQTSNASSADLVFGTRNNGTRSEKMRINSSGDVGIGTSSPGTKLQVGDGTANDTIRTVFSDGSYTDIHGYGLEMSRGFSYIRPTTSNTQTLYIGEQTTGNNWSVISNNASTHIWRNSSSERMRIDSSGRVGIGTTSPNQLLEVANSAGGATISISTDQQPGSQAVKKYMNLDFTGYNNDVMSRIQSWDESSSTGHGNLTFSTRNASTALLSQRMIIDYAGRVGIGTSDVEETLTIAKTDGGDGTIVGLRSDASFSQFEIATKNSQVDWGLQTIGARNMYFTTNGSERMRITSGGAAFFYGQGTAASGTINLENDDPFIRLYDNGAGGTTDKKKWDIRAIGYPGSEQLDFRTVNDANTVFATKLTIKHNGQLLVGVQSSQGASSRVSAKPLTTSGVCYETKTDSDGYYPMFFHNAAGVQKGYIFTNATSTSYNTSSDYRLKENVVEMTGALDRVSQLKPSRFNFIADADKTVDGFLAHEVQEIVPEAISGEKDAVDEKGNPDYQGIDQSKLVPLLVAAIQELKADNDSLKARIETLENN